MLEFPGGLDSGRNDFDIKTGARYSMDGWWVEHGFDCPQFCWEKAMAAHSSTLAWKILWTDEPGSLLHGVAKSLTLLSEFTFTFLHWRRKWPTPVFSPGESQGRGSLVGCRLWGRTELDTTEAT